MTDLQGAAPQWRVGVDAPDYEMIGRCMFPVAAPNTAAGEDDCGEAAAYRVWWNKYDDAWLVCPQHFTTITGQPHADHNAEARLRIAVDALRAWERWEAMAIMECSDAWWANMPAAVNDAMIAAQAIRNDALKGSSHE